MEDEVTPEHLFKNRRRWIQAAAIATSLPLTTAAYRWLNPVDQGVQWEPLIEGMVDSPLSRRERLRQGFEVSDWKSSFYDITHLNNFHEFTSDQQAVAATAKDFSTSDWTLEIGGLVDRPLKLNLQQIRELFPVEERIYRMRCVEAWSMVIPWAGFPLAALLEKVRPTSAAQYVAFETLTDRERFPNQVPGELSWPYVEGLRLDEAMHPLAFIATGLYRRELPAANGAPLRLVVPWKYGFKSIKSLVKVTLVDKQPPTAWNKAAAHENGFYANVNPEVDHPRWSQATERRVGELLRRDTLLFNGYEKQVESLYRGMDLRVNY